MPRPSAPVSPAATPVQIALGLGVLYVIWGSTYFGIRVAIDTLPPLLLCGVRYLTAGGLLFAWSIRQGHREGDRLTRAHWLSALLIGGALLTIGNGGVAWSEQRVSSGIAALLVAMSPLWMALLNRLMFGVRASPRVGAGILLSMAGIVLLARPWAADRLDPLGTLVLLVAPLSWAAGSVFSRGAVLPGRPLVATSMQMLCGGALALVVSLILGEPQNFVPSQVSAKSLLALAYLIVFGSIVAYSAYVWLLRAAPLSLVSTYAYVNPVVAVALGWAFLDEPLTPATLSAAGIIVAAVVLMVTGSAPKPVAEPAVPTAQPSEAG